MEYENTVQWWFNYFIVIKNGELVVDRLLIEVHPPADKEFTQLL